jgi:hypothetical protein
VKLPRDLSGGIGPAAAPYIFSFFAAAQPLQRRNFLERMLGGFQCGSSGLPSSPFLREKTWLL